MNLRQYRFFGLAIIDYIITLIAVLILHSYMWFNANVKKKRTYIQYFISLIYIFIGILAIATILHYFFNIKSVFSSYLGFND